MRTTRANFKALLRQCKVKSNKADSDKLAQSMLNSKPRAFWKEIKKINRTDKASPLPSAVGGEEGCERICKMWHDHFAKLLNPTGLKQSISVWSKYNCSFDSVDSFVHNEVNAGLKSLKTGKSAGNDGLNAEAFKFADKKITVYLCILFNVMLCHGYLPSKLMETIIVPILKDKKGDLGSKDNYRPIALTTVVSKLFEILILNRYQHLLQTTDHQFGFKQSHSTDLCVYTFKQVIEYYKSRSSPVYICFLDASKAFDRVNHNLLFHKLLSRNLPSLIVRILHVWYASQCFSVKWGSLMSSGFHVTCGVRQGGILSPVLFNVYVNCLSVKLRSLHLGCHINEVCYNHLIYADDTVLLAPSPKALQLLINECVLFAKENDLVFNRKKTKFLCVKPTSMKTLYVPDFYLEEDRITVVDKETYLGFIVNEQFSDDDHIVKEMRNVYARGNMIIRYFSHCTDAVRIQLFKSFCSNLYCCPLWYKFKKSTLKKLHTACNKIFKSLMLVPRNFSASLLFVSCNVENFTVLRRKLIYGLILRIKASRNLLVRNLLLLKRNSMHSYWNNLLNI